MNPEFLEAGIDFERANAARMYDFYLGGAHNFAVDRDQVAKVLAGYPDAPRAARANRAFLGHAVRWCQAQGITQFLDLGSGVPTVGNVHEIARETDPDARVAYVDFEPVAVAHAQQLLHDIPGVTATRADLGSGPRRGPRATSPRGGKWPGAGAPPSLRLAPPGQAVGGGDVVGRVLA